MPISMAVAPARINSMASRPFIIPPSPTTGIFTAFATCHTMRTATGRTAGPDSPPVIVDRYGRIFSTSMAMPIIVLISETASAPSDSTAFAISEISVTLGDSFTMTVPSNDFLTARVTDAAPSHVVPKAIPPCLTLGQDMLTSMQHMSVDSFSRRQTAV